MNKETNLVPYNLRMPKDLKRRLERKAKDEKRSLNKQIIHLLETAFDAPQKAVA